MDSVATLHNWSNTASTDNGPDHESDSGDGNEVRLDSEEMTDLVNREPNSWEGAEPEDEERHPVSCGCLLTFEAAGVDGIAVPGFPDGADHKVDAVAADVGLDTVPNTSFTLSVSFLSKQIEFSFGTHPLLND